MRHKMVTTTFGRSTAHRQAMMAAMVCSLISEKRIETTVHRAKAAGRLADKMITLGKSGTVADRRRAAAVLRRKSAVKALFDEVAPQFKDREGGYTRVVRLGKRKGDGATMAILEFVSVAYVDKKKKPAADKDSSPAGSKAE